MHRASVRSELLECADLYEERSRHYAPDDNFVEEGMSMISSFLEDCFSSRHAGVGGRYVLPPGTPDEVAIWSKVGDKIARIRTRGVPGFEESNASKSDFIDDVEDLIVFLAMGVCKLREESGAPDLQIDETLSVGGTD